MTALFGLFDVAQKNPTIVLTSAFNSNLMSSEGEGNEKKKENAVLISELSVGRSAGVIIVSDWWSHHPHPLYNSKQRLQAKTQTDKRPHVALFLSHGSKKKN